MKKMLAIVLLGAGFVSQVIPSDNYPNCPPCNISTPSPAGKETNKGSAPATPRNNSNDKK